MAPTLPLVLLAVLPACNPPWHGIADSGDTPGDSRPDTDDTGGGTTDVRFVITDPWEGTALALYRVTVAATGDLRFGEAAAAATVASAQALLHLAEPPAEAFTDWDTDLYPGLRVAWHSPAVYDDADGDVQKDTEELVVGAGPAMVVFLSGPLGDLAGLGFEQGWNAFVVGSKGDLIETPLESVPAAADLWPGSAVADIEIGGTWEGVTDADDLGLAVVSDLWPENPALDLVHEVPRGFVKESWDVILDEEPPYDHRTWREAYGADAAIEYPIAWRDVDGDGAFTDADTVVGGTCYDHDTERYQPAFLVYLPSTASLDLAWMLERLDLHLGWIVESVVGGERTFLNPSGGRGLVMAESCVPTF